MIASNLRPWKISVNVSATVSLINATPETNFHLFFVTLQGLAPPASNSSAHISLIFERLHDRSFTRALVVNYFDGSFLAGVWLPTQAREWQLSSKGTWTMTVVLEYIHGQAWPKDSVLSLTKAVRSPWWYIGSRLPVSHGPPLNPSSCSSCPLVVQKLERHGLACSTLDLVSSLKFGFWQDSQWIAAGSKSTVELLPCLRKINIVIIGDSTSKYFAAALRKAGVQKVRFHEVWGLKKINIKFRGTDTHEPATFDKWLRLIKNSQPRTQSQRTNHLHARTIVVLNSGIHDIARDNLFSSFSDSLKSLKSTLLLTNQNNSEFVWRLTNSIHESAISNRKKFTASYKNTMTSLRNEVNTFLAADIMLPEVSILDGFLPSRCAPDSMMMPGDIRHLTKAGYDPWVRSLASFACAS